MRFIGLDDHKLGIFGIFYELFLTVVVLMSAFKNKNSLRTFEAEISYKVKNNEARPKFTGSYKKKCVVKIVSILSTIVSQ